MKTVTSPELQEIKETPRFKIRLHIPKRGGRRAERKREGKGIGSKGRMTGLEDREILTGKGTKGRDRNGWMGKEDGKQKGRNW